MIKGKKSSKKITKTRSVAPTSSKVSEPKTMEELLAYSGKITKGLSKGQRVRGKVIGIYPKSLILDIGGKGEGLVAEKAYLEARSFISTLKMGDEINAKVLIPETPDGYTILSLREASYDSSWEKLEKTKDETGAVSVVGKAVSPSGIIVDVAGLTGFIPRSQLGKEISKNPESAIGKEFKAHVIEIDRSENKIVLSEKAVSEGQDLKTVRKAFDDIKEGEILEGKITSLSDFGCFVEVERNGDRKKVTLEGLVHISELSWDKVRKASDVVSLGDKVKVKVIAKKDGKLAFSIKQAGEDPWEKIEENYKKDARVRGRVIRLSNFGVFVSLAPGIEGLIHITKIPPGKKLKEGEEIDVYIEEVDGQAKRLSLGLVLTEKPVGYK